MNYDTYEQSDTQIKANLDIEKARINAEALKYEKKLEGRDSMREQGLIFAGIAGVAGVILSFIWCMFMDMNADGIREDQMQDKCQVSGGVWATTNDYEDEYTCIPAGSDLKPKDVYKEG